MCIRDSDLAEKTHNKISIMPGGGIRSNNINEFLYNKYLNEFHSSCIIDNEFKEIEVENLIKENKQRMKILILCLIFHPHMRLQYIVYH